MYLTGSFVLGDENTLTLMYDGSTFTPNNTTGTDAVDFPPFGAIWEGVQVVTNCRQLMAVVNLKSQIVQFVNLTCGQLPPIKTYQAKPDHAELKLYIWYL